MSNREEFNNRIATVLVSYTRWILREAQSRNIHRLYFLARDGWLMYHIAEQICRTEKLNINCSYFYCSRYSLRAGAYRFFDDSAYEKLFLHSYRQTASDMLTRAGFSKQKRYQVYEDIGFDSAKELDIMGRQEFDGFCGKVKGSKVFRSIISEISEEAYQKIMRYIGQEGMNRYKKIGIVDLGWTGSLQYTLHKLLESSRINTHITGFYMGMLDAPPRSQGSVYLTWLFNEQDIKIKSWFAHNLMECICCAPHGMTLGYEQDEKKMVPVFSDEENSPDHITEIKTAAVNLAVERNNTGEIGSRDIPGNSERKAALKLLYQIMYSPSDMDIELLKTYTFCDDVGEQYHKSIVQEGKAKDFRREILPFKLMHRDETDGFFWYFGSLKKSRVHFKGLYKIGYRLTRKIIERRKLNACHSERSEES